LGSIADEADSYSVLEAISSFFDNSETLEKFYLLRALKEMIGRSEGSKTQLHKKLVEMARSVCS
jgi:hypothetical protein